jgi:hypothetical protein
MTTLAPQSSAWIRNTCSEVLLAKDIFTQVFASPWSACNDGARIECETFSVRVPNLPSPERRTVDACTSSSRGSPRNDLSLQKNSVCQSQSCKGSPNRPYHIQEGLRTPPSFPQSRFHLLWEVLLEAMSGIRRDPQWDGVSSQLSILLEVVERVRPARDYAHASCDARPRTSKRY